MTTNQLTKKIESLGVKVEKIEIVENTTSDQNKIDVHLSYESPEGVQTIIFGLVDENDKNLSKIINNLTRLV